MSAPERYRSLLQRQQKKLRQQMLVLTFVAGIGGGNNGSEGMNGGTVRWDLPAFTSVVRVRRRSRAGRNGRRQQAVEVDGSGAPGGRHGHIQQIAKMRRAPPIVERKRRKGRRETVAHGCRAMGKGRRTGDRSPS